MELNIKNFEDMKISEVKKLHSDYHRVSNELEYVKTKYPKAKEELEDENFDIDKFLESC